MFINTFSQISYIKNQRGSRMFDLHYPHAHHTSRHVQLDSGLQVLLSNILNWNGDR